LRVGILGGAFNPPHLGHLVCAQEASTQLKLDRVLLMPVGEAPHRQVEQDPGREVRMGLCEVAVGGDPRLSVSRAEVDREGPSYMADTLRGLHNASPGDELVLVLGGDQAASLADWHEAGEVIELATIAVAERTGFDRERVLRGVSSLHGAHERLTFFAMPTIDLSSSLIRRRVAEGAPIRYLVPDAVAERIAAEGLYGGSDRVGARG
jgi:nicotinate-nucleotide adenylyltransferase